MDNKQIPLRLVREVSPIDHGLVASQPSLLSAIKLCISVAGFDCDKQVYGALDIDAGHWSRIHRGEAHFPTDKLIALMELCGNEAPLMWLLHHRGYDLHSLRKRESETEAQLRLEREARLEAEKKLAYLESLHTGRK